MVTDKVDGRGRPRKPEGSETPTRSVKLERVLTGKAELVAKTRGLSLSDYIASAARSTVEADFAKLVQSTAGAKK